MNILDVLKEGTYLHRIDKNRGFFTLGPTRLLGILASLHVCKFFRKVPPYSFIRHTFSLHV